MNRLTQQIAGCVGALVVLAGTYKLGWEQHELLHPEAVRSTSSVSIPSLTEETPPEEKPDLKYGMTYRWGNNPGITTKVDSPKRVTVKDSIGQQYKYFFEFTIVITNVTKSKWDIEVSPIDFDVEGGAFYSGDYPETIAPGKTVTLKHIFGVTTLESPVFTITTDMGYGPTIRWG